MILVTGGTGLVGTYLLHELTRKGQKVRALLRPGKKQYDVKNLFDCLPHDDKNRIGNIEWVEGESGWPII